MKIYKVDTWACDDLMDSEVFKTKVMALEYALDKSNKLANLGKRVNVFVEEKELRYSLDAQEQ